MVSSQYRTSEFFPESAIARSSLFSILDESESKRPYALVYCQNLHYLHLAIKNPNISTVITTPELAAEVADKGLIIDKNPRLLFFELYAKLQKKGLLKPEMAFGRGKNCKIHPSAVVSDLSRLGDEVSIGPNVVIHDYVSIGDRTVIESNAVVGAEGMLTIWRDDETPLIVPHAGGVNIGEDVVILAGAVIAKSLYCQFTEISDRCQIGILTNIGHGTRIGKCSIISGNCIIAGRVVLGNSVWVGASSSIAQGLEIGDNAQIKMGSVVVGNLRPDEIVSGNFAMDHKRNMKRYLELTR